jgi:penicillin-binding protein 1A
LSSRGQVQSSGGGAFRGARPGERFSGPPGPLKVAGSLAFAILLLLAVVAGSLTGLMLVYSVNLPQIADLERYRPETTTELLDVHGRVFGSFALQRRVEVNYEDFPPVLRHAVISIEDKNFESHWGVNLVRVLGAAYHDLVSNSRNQGASTLTMQLARNLFLSSERTFGRKLQEVFLSIQIERSFTKQQIFTLYANQIYLGQGVYGFEAGSEYYFSKRARDLTLPEAALLAGLPKAPVGYSPISNPTRAFRRRNTVINAMLEDGVITAAEANAAKTAPLGLHIEPPPNSVAPWFVEAVRRDLERQFGSEQVHEAGLRVYTTLDLDLQRAADAAVLDGLAAYERHRKWQGHLLNVIDAGASLDEFHHPDWVEAPIPGAYMHALVTSVLPFQVNVRLGQRQAILGPDDFAWTGQRDAQKFLKPGDIVYVRIQPSADSNLLLHATLEQDSGAQGALLAIDNASGEVRAMVGGRDFELSQFNRATQAERQAGSAFKPYVYAAAVESGMGPQDRILDAPVTFSTPSGPYTPRNFDNTYEGTVSLIHAFADSRNIPAVKLAERVGIRKVIETARGFGIVTDIPPVLGVALGSADVTLQEQVSAYTSFPNDGVRIAPHLIRKVTNSDGFTLSEVPSSVAESTDVRTARIMTQFLESVLQPGGTAAAAGALKHPLGGKTGTTSNYVDAWFIGFSPSITCGTWVGYDDRQSLGDGETGALAALPIWMDLMKVAIADRPDETFSGQAAPRLKMSQAASLPSGSPQAEAPPMPPPAKRAPAKLAKDGPSPVANR